MIGRRGRRIASTVRQAPVLGGAAGQLSGATNEVDAAADGTIYVADTLADRVVSYSPSFLFEGAFGFDVVPGGGTDFEVCTTATGCKVGNTGAGFGQFALLKSVAVDCREGIWTTDLENDRVTRFGEPGTAAPPCLPEQTKAQAPIADLAPAAPSTSTASKAGEALLSIKARGKAGRALKEKGRVSVAFTVTFTPTGGEPKAEAGRIVLKRRLPHGQ